jgi:raffinose/stachyose/melibiose transport system substrate-binding protein
MRKFTLFVLLVVVALILAACGGPATQAPAEQPAATEAPAEAPAGEKVTLTIDSWRNDDLQIWQDTIIPAFEAKYPNIHVVFAPTAPAEYNGVLNTKLEGGTAGDLITCRPFDASLELYNKGYLAPLNDLAGMENFSDVARAPGSLTCANVFCVQWRHDPHFFNKKASIKLVCRNLPLGRSFSRCLKRSRRMAHTRLWRWAPPTCGNLPPWASRTSALCIGKAKKVARL